MGVGIDDRHRNSSMSQESQLYPEARRPARRYDLDWLKVIATLTVFIFHCLRFFDWDAWHVKNNQLDAIATALTAVLAQWIMPLFFLLSGASIYYALSFRTAGQFLQERCLRLLVPLLFGIFVFSPPQVYLERLSNSIHGVAPWQGGQAFSGSFWEFIPFYFQGWYLFGGNFAWMGIHLWYLLVLFLYSVLILPLALALRQNPVQKLVAKLIVWCQAPMAIFLLALPISLLESGLDPVTIGVRAAGGWNFFTYLICLIYGYCLVAEQRLEQALHRQGLLALVLVLLTTPLLLLGQIHEMFADSVSYGSLGYALITTLRAFNAGFWLIALLSFGSRFFSFNSQTLRYTSEATLPFYILHQPVILILGFYLREWDIGAWPKFLVLSVSAFGTIALLYELFVRRINGLRFLFGLKLR
jgi:surface polysaccharide O-acyltransferase-like enzyme